MKELKKVNQTIEGIKVLTKTIDGVTSNIGIQLQTSVDFETKSGELNTKIHTVKVVGIFEESELPKLIGKSIEITEENELKEYDFGFGKMGFKCTGFKVLDKIHDIAFEYSYGVIGKITTIVTGVKKNKVTGEEIPTTTFNIKYIDGINLQMKSIKVLQAVKNHKDLIGKNLEFSSIKSVKVDMNTYLSTEIAPKLVK